MHEVSGQEVQFALKVEELLSSITIPEYRQVIVEVSKYSPPCSSFSLPTFYSCTLQLGPNVKTIANYKYFCGNT